ncbi:MAG: fasciclin domain-containing protein [Flavobacteriaceae bacterium]|nr:fasciclin domain-containing protein [Flavobacteriaceae bacterium]
MKNFNLLLIIVFAFSLTACKETPKEQTPTTKVERTEVNTKGQSAVDDKVSDPNALQVAKSLDDFKTLVVAIKAAGVEDALVNAGPLTVFAPVNGAFDKLPKGTVEDLLKPENKSKLAFILKNHVAPANFPIKTLEKNVRKNRKLFMASGKYLEVTKKGEDLYVGGTKILKTVKVSNGWVHVIGDILVPSDK